MKLLQCLDCGQALSSEARQCPACNSLHPFGVTCSICDSIVVYKERVEWSAGRRKYGHARCVQDVLQDMPLQCRACGATLPSLHQPGNRMRDFLQHETCPACGQPNPRNESRRCDKCYLGIFDQHYVERKMKQYTAPLRFHA